MRQGHIKSDNGGLGHEWSSNGLQRESIERVGGLPKGKINEVINFIGYLKSMNAKRRKDKKIDVLDAGDNVLLSIIGIGESAVPHDLAQNHDKYVYGDL